jgi:MYND finger
VAPGCSSYQQETVSATKDKRELSLCGGCGAPGAAQLCTGCHHVRYCSKGCQRAHWKGGHKGVCAELCASTQVARAETKAAKAASSVCLATKEQMLASVHW